MRKYRKNAGLQAAEKTAAPLQMLRFQLVKKLAYGVFFDDFAPFA